jgi:hypothetical protein
MDAFLDWWEAQTPADRGQPVHIWWRRGQGAEDDLHYGDPVILYQCREVEPRAAPGFRAVATSLSGGPLHRDGRETLLPIHVVTRFTRVIPLGAVTKDPVLSQHYFSRFSQVTRYLFRGRDAQRLAEVLAAQLPAGEGERLAGLLRTT